MVYNQGYVFNQYPMESYSTNTGVIGLSEDPGGWKIRRDGEVHVEVEGMEKAELGGRESSKYSMG
jgi:hypothetical protein